MKTIRCWQDLEQFGIDPLTGEACGYAMRLLCDVTAQGKRLIESFLGGCVEIREGSNWNNGSKDDPHVGSVLLSRGMLAELGAFCLLQTTRDSMIVALENGDIAEYTAEDIAYMRELWSDVDDTDQRFEELFERWSFVKIRRYYRRPNVQTRERNTHAMSGRTI